MPKTAFEDAWSAGPSYDHFMGRWSQLIARVFLKWLAPHPGLRWLEVGCGTGALTGTILDLGAPASIFAIDHSEGFIEYARTRLTDSRIVFQVGDANDLPALPDPVDMAVSGLALNFFPDPVTALAAMRRSLQPAGTLAFYVWDYAGKMEMLKYFWDTAIALDPQAQALDESLRFPICNPEALQQLCRQAGLEGIKVTALEANMVFSGFEDYWAPFLEGTGPAAAYVSRLDMSDRRALEDRLRATLPVQETGSIKLAARAWAVRGLPKNCAQIRRSTPACGLRV